MDYRAIDTHCHPQFPQYDADRDAVIRRALDAGVGMVCVGTNLASSEQAIGLAGRYDGLYASVGLHPNDDLTERFDPDAYREIAAHAKVVALGEIGLDHYRITELRLLEFQKVRFGEQLDLARELQKPVIVHCRDAHKDMRDMLAAHDMHDGVIHSFTGDLADALHYIEIGFHIGFNGIITFARQYDRVVKEVPLDRILLETDAPYLAPKRVRGKRNEPVHVLEVAQTVAELKNLSPEEVLTRTTQNSMNLFGIK